MSDSSNQTAEKDFFGIFNQIKKNPASFSMWVALVLILSFLAYVMYAIPSLGARGSKESSACLELDKKHKTDDYFEKCKKNNKVDDKVCFVVGEVIYDHNSFTERARNFRDSVREVALFSSRINYILVISAVVSGVFVSILFAKVSWQLWLKGNGPGLLESWTGRFLGTLFIVVAAVSISVIKSLGFKEKSENLVQVVNNINYALNEMHEKYNLCSPGDNYLKVNNAKSECLPDKYREVIDKGVKDINKQFVRAYSTMSDVNPEVQLPNPPNNTNTASK